MVFKKKNNYWWSSLALGILAVLVGILVFLHPIIGLSILTILFTSFFFISGIIEITSGTKINSIGLILNGVINLSFSIILLIIPTPSSILIFIFYVGFYILFQSILGLLTGIKLSKSATKSGSPFIAISIVGILLAIIILINPQVFSSFIIFIFALAFLSYGAYKIYYAIKFK